MTTDRKAIDDMAGIMQMLNARMQSGETPGVIEPVGNPDFDPNAGYDLSEGYNPSATSGFDPETGEAPNGMSYRTPVGSTESEDMKRILLALRGAQSEETPVRPRDPVLVEAMATERTPRGARVGSWEILIKEGQSTKTYDVISESGETVIARDLYLYSAAEGIAKCLNEGGAINDRKVRSLLALEEEFAKNRNDATGYKQRAKKLTERGDTMKAAVAEDRHDEAARQALAAHEEILRLAGIRR